MTDGVVAVPDPSCLPIAHTEEIDSDRVPDDMPNSPGADAINPPDPTSSAVHRFPAEILCMIFRTAGECGMDMHTNFYIASVCSYWREVAHADPQMWTRYNLTGHAPFYPTKATLEALIARSRPFPLEIYGNIKLGSWIFQLVMANIDRVSLLQTLSLTPSGAFNSLSDSDLKLFFGVVSGSLKDSPAPMLEALRVTDVPPTMYTLPRANIHLISDVPRLKKLDMSGPVLAWNSKFYKNLSDLRIVIPTQFEISQDPVEYDIIKVLHASLDLVNLDIDSGTLSPHLHHPFHFEQAPPSLYMHALRSIKLSLREDLAIRLLTGITLPECIRDVEVRIYCRHPTSLCPFLELHFIPPALLSSLKHLRIDSISQATISGRRRSNRTWNIKISGGGTFRDRAPFHLQIDHVFCIGANVDPERRTLARVLSMFGSMPVLNKLSLQDTNAVGIPVLAEEIAAMLTRTPALTRLTLYDSGIVEHLDDLRDAILARATTDDHALPQLECVYIGYTRAHHFVDEDAFADALIGFLELFRLHIHELHIDVPAIRLDRDICARVVALRVPRTWWANELVVL